MTVMRLRGTCSRCLASAEETRSSAFFYRALRQPTVTNVGRPLAILVSTSTRYASIQRTAAERIAREHHAGYV